MIILLILYDLVLFLDNLSIKLKVFTHITSSVVLMTSSVIIIKLTKQFFLLFKLSKVC